MKKISKKSKEDDEWSIKKKEKWCIEEKKQMIESIKHSLCTKF